MYGSKPHEKFFSCKTTSKLVELGHLRLPYWVSKYKNIGARNESHGKMHQLKE